MVAPEEGTWRCDEITVSSSRSRHTDRFVCKCAPVFTGYFRHTNLGRGRCSCSPVLSVCRHACAFVCARMQPKNKCLLGLAARLFGTALKGSGT